jgi:hypothetical protein
MQSAIKAFSTIALAIANLIPIVDTYANALSRLYEHLDLEPFAMNKK